MGKEIRRVPGWWEHPRRKDVYVEFPFRSRQHPDADKYWPCEDANYDDACQEWLEGFALWQAGQHPIQLEGGEYSKKKYFWDAYLMPPDDKYLRTGRFVFTSEEATHYQIYETVSQGTPTSPVFETLDAVADWLVSRGYTRDAAEAFCQDEAESFLVVDESSGQIASDILR